MNFKQPLSGWGLYPKSESRLIETGRAEEVFPLIANEDGLIARGNGRSYGDSSLYRTVFSTRRLNRFLRFDKEAAILSCESGVLLSEILNLIVPEGFFLSVLPGTQQVSLGGAIASDVHGKNHAQAGAFSRQLISFNLLRSDGKMLRCSREENAELFRHTCGGMGLTGIILRAELHLVKIESAFFRTKNIRTGNLAETLEAFAQHPATHQAAWIDCLCPAEKSGRGILSLGEQARASDLPGKNKEALFVTGKKKKFDLPFFFPAFVMNTAAMRFFNARRYRRSGNPEEKIQHYQDFLFPLDAIGNWNRMYGRKGFLQYQFVLPEESSKQGLPELLTRVRKENGKPFLAVLKYFGEADPGFPFSFPQRGFSLALDFRYSPAVFRLMDLLDEIVLHHGGKIYLTKDARMHPGTFRKFYTGKIDRDPFFRSDQSVRLQW